MRISRVLVYQIPIVIGITLSISIANSYSYENLGIRYLGISISRGEVYSRAV